MTSQPGKRTNVVHILLNISRRKDNETLKFGQLIECNMRNVFLEKSYTKCGRKTISRLFSKKNQNWAYLWINGLKLYTVYFYFMPSQGLSKDITSYNLIYLILPHIYTSLPLILPHLLSHKKLFFGITFEEKYFYCYILSTDQISLSDCLYFARY